LFLRNFLGIPLEEVEEQRNRGSFLAPLPNFLGIPSFFSAKRNLGTRRNFRNS